MTNALAVAPGIKLWPLRFDPLSQADLLSDVFAGIKAAPLFDPTMPRTGKKFSVRMTNFGPLGWVSDAEKGYRYEPAHPATGQPWPAIPEALLRLWTETTGYNAPPEACLVNFYSSSARMGLHRDQAKRPSRRPCSRSPLATAPISASERRISEARRAV